MKMVFCLCMCLSMKKPALGGFGLVDVFCHSAHKADKCKCSLCRHNAVAAALEALGAAIVHPVGQPINHSVKAGFKRRGEVGPVLDDSWPGGVGWAWGKDWCST